MSEKPLDNPELQSLREEVDRCMQEVQAFDHRIEERNQKRLLLIQELNDLLPEEQHHRFEEILNKTVESVKISPDPSTLPPVDFDQENPLESLRKIRTQIAQEVCSVMGIEAPEL